nr:ThuA domain-containing protein [Microbacterium sp. ZXX196]
MGGIASRAGAGTAPGRGAGVSGPRVVVAVGTGRYADPWHPFGEVARALAAWLVEAGCGVDVREDVDVALAGLDGADLLVVCAGDPWRGDEARRGADPAASAGLGAALRRGIGVLAVHAAVSSLRDYPDWRRAIGGGWVVGRSGHPPIGDARFVVAEPGYPATAGIREVRAYDERYAGLDIDAGARILLTSDVDGRAEPAAWALERNPGRSVVSTLGHDGRAMQSGGHRRFLVSAALWAAGADPRHTAS